MNYSSNITLIGMPGSGKSTVGVVLAKLLCMTFIDGDILIQNREEKRLHKIIEEVGNEGFLKIENSILASLKVNNSVISTGGSAIFGKEAMENLKKISTVIYLDVPYEILEKRLRNLKRRGVVLEEGQTLKDVYDIRTPLYRNYADITIHVGDDCDIQETALRIIELIDK